MVRIEHLGSAGGEEQYEYLRRNPNALLYGTPRFMSLISHHLGAQAGWLIARRDDEVVGLLPYLRKDGALGPVFNSLAYYGSNGGVIQQESDEEAKAALISGFYMIAQEAEAISATIINNPLERDADFYQLHAGHNCRDERIGQFTHFPPNADPEQLMALFEDPRPRNIRRALREGITVERSHEREAIEFLYAAHLENMQSIGGLPKQRSFFDLLPSIMQESDWAIYQARLHERLIASLLVFYFNRTVEYFTPVVVEAYRNAQPLALVIYRCMQAAVERGFANWNWGGTWLSQRGVYDFKKRWGTTEYRYYYYTRVFKDALRKETKDSLLSAYAGFYVLPFSELRPNDQGAVNHA